MNKKNEEKSRSKGKNRVQRIKEKLKRNSDQSRFIPLPDYPQDRCTEPPEKVENIVSMKWVKRNPINMQRKYHAVLDSGILQLLDKKKTDVGLHNEYRIDLSKVEVLYDDKRAVLKFQTESLVLRPLDTTFAQWKATILKHRLYRQEQNVKEATPELIVTTPVVEAKNSISAREDFRDFDLNGSTLRILENVKEIQNLTLQVLDRTTRQLEELKATSNEIRSFHAEIREIMVKSTTATSGVVTTPVSAESLSFEDDTDDIISDADASILLQDQNKNPEILYSLESVGIMSKKDDEVIQKSLNILTEAPLKPTKSEGRTMLLPVDVDSPIRKPTEETEKKPAAKKQDPPVPKRLADEPLIELSIKKSLTALPPAPPAPPPKKVRRDVLPAEQCQSEGIGIRAMYHMITTKSGMPLSHYEPLGTLQVLCEDLIWSELIDKAATMKQPEDRMANVVGFALSAYTNGLGRFRKPFNPLLGETFDYEENGWKYHAEQVSHHPPVSAAWADGKQWTWWNTLSVETSLNKFSNSCEFTSPNLVRLRLKTENGVEEYSWNKVKSKIEGLTAPPEQRKISHGGTMNIKCSNGYYAKVVFKPLKDPSEIVGDVCTPNNIVSYVLHGYWDKYLNKRSTKGEVRCVYDGSLTAHYANFYGFSRFSMGLNEVDVNVILAPTDSRLRPDVRALEQGNVTKAAQCKEALETAQRNRTKPVGVAWFDLNDDTFTKRRVYFSNGKYWTNKEKGFKELKSVDLFAIQ